MKRFGLLKVMAPVFLAASMIFGMSTVAQAYDKTDAISSISLNITYDLSSGMTKDDVYVTSDTSGIDSVTVSSITNTSSGNRPKVTLSIKAERSDGYYFSSDDASTLKTSSAFDLSGDTSTYYSSKRSSDTTVTLVVRLSKIDGTSSGDLEVSSIDWDSSDSGSVTWTAADDADKYYVKLLRGSTVKESVDTTDTSYDFSSYITATGTYYVKVRAYNNGTYGAWVTSDSFYVDSDTLSDIKSSASSSSSSSGSSNGPGTSASSSTGAWLKDDNGWWYCNADRTYTTSNWQQINGYWYYFNENGYMKTGWLQSPASGKWYYLSTTDGSTLGRMMTSYWTPDNYYVDADGVWVEGKTK